jgi:DNA-binding CsgD family transcriptional regulator
MVQALALVRAGGVFLPANSLLMSQRMTGELPTPSRAGLGMFTTKQAAVIEAIRKGKANKTIAYELNMCESTVKVHVRNIMKKLKARNRTQWRSLPARCSGRASTDRGALLAIPRRLRGEPAHFTWHSSLRPYAVRCMHLLSTSRRSLFATSHTPFARVVSRAQPPR